MTLTLMFTKALIPLITIALSPLSMGVDLFEDTANLLSVASLTLDRSSTTGLFGSNPSGSIQAISSGGPNGSSYIQFNNSWTAGDGGNSGVGNYWLFSDWTYDPSHISIAASIDFFGSIDVINDPENIGVGVVAKQDGRFTFSFYDPNQQATWNTVSGTNTTGLTTDGGLIEFGIFTANSTGNTSGSPINLSRTGGLDNLSVKLTSAVPEPSSALLTLLGSFGLVLRRRR